jgi:phosphonate transport system permease protein
MKNDIVTKTYNLQPKHLKRNLFLSFIFTTLLVWSLGILNYSGSNETGLTIARSIFLALFNPSQNLLFSFGVDSIPFLMFETLGIAVLGTILGAVLSVPFAFLSSRNIVGKYFSWFGNTIITIIRTFPFFVLALMFVRVTGPGPFTGVLTTAVLSIGMMSKLYIESIEDIDRGVLDALDATGATTFQKIRYGILPQLTANFISVVLLRFDINVKNATVLGLVGAGGIGFTLISAMGSFRWNDVAAALIGIIVVVLVVEFFSNFIRNKLTSGE